MEFLERITENDGEVYVDFSSMNLNEIPNFNDYDELVEYIPKIVDMNLSFNNISDLKNIELYTNLRSLNLSYNKLTIVSDLKKLSKLTDLNVSNNRLMSVNGLGDLRYLDLSFNNITEIEELSGDLIYLHVGLTNIKELNVLSDLYNIETLILTNKHYFDLSVLRNLSKLKRLVIGENKYKTVPSVMNYDEYIHHLENGSFELNKVETYNDSQYCKLIPNFDISKECCD